MRESSMRAQSYVEAVGATASLPCSGCLIMESHYFGNLLLRFSYLSM